ncbi:MAG: MBL fold metallo-hydrolase [Candidatus Eisenbacteria sp.]|nr:MBL fold metallo-hydrolase [Candidatus Eisenbacteria bacterium]
MKIAVLASGSSGNAIWVSSGSTAVLIDAGVSGRRVAQAAEGLGLDTTELSAVLVTHEHSDHVSGLGPVTRRFDVPVCATAGTHAAIDRRLGKCPGRTIVEAGTDFEIGDLLVSPFLVSHDCAEPVGYSVSDGRTVVAVATDLGVVSHPVRDRIGRADCVVLEFNHDEQMLRDGDYPWFLKQRIMGTEGHLSNEAAARELVSLGDGPMSALVLAHLSRENNTPDLALATARDALERAGRSDVDIHVAEQNRATGPICLGLDAQLTNVITSTGVQASCTR